MSTRLYFKGYEPSTADVIRDDMEVTRRYYKALEKFNGLVAKDLSAEYKGISEQANYLESLGEAAMKEVNKDDSKLTKLLGMVGKPSEPAIDISALKEFVGPADAKGLLPGFDIKGDINNKTVTKIIGDVIKELRGTKKGGAPHGDAPAFKMVGTDLEFVDEPCEVMLAMPNRISIKITHEAHQLRFSVFIKKNRIEWLNNPDLLLLSGTTLGVDVVMASGNKPSPGTMDFLNEIVILVLHSTQKNKPSYAQKWMKYIEHVAKKGSGLSRDTESRAEHESDTPDTNQAILNQLNINIGALEAGNHNRKIVSRAFKLIDQLYQNQAITKAERTQLESRVEAVFNHTLTKNRACAKMSHWHVVLSNNHGDAITDRIEKYHNPPIPLNSLQYEVALNQLTMYNSWFNVSDQLNNRVFKYFNGTDNRTLTIDEGTYSFTSLAAEIHKLMLALGDATLEVDGSYSYDINFQLDLSSGYVDLLLSNGYTVDFTNQNIRILFGFNSGVYAAAKNTSETVSDINAGLRQIHVHLSNVQSYMNGALSDVIYTFTPDAAPSALITEKPLASTYVGLNTRTDLSHLRVWLTDQDNNRLDLQGFPMHVSLHYRVSGRA